MPIPMNPLWVIAFLFRDQISKRRATVRTITIIEKARVLAGVVRLACLVFRVWDSACVLL
jgi:hypothetical protein